MAVGYVPKWMPLLEAIQHIQSVTGDARRGACDALLIALCDAGVVSRVRGQAVRPGAGVDPERWYRATVFCDGSVDFTDDTRFPILRPFPRELGPLRYQIEVRRSDVLKWWPAASEPPESEPVTEQSTDAKPAATQRQAETAEAEAAPRRARIVETKRDAVKAWIAERYPSGIPAGVTAKAIARDFAHQRSIAVNVRTVSRALGRK